MNVVVGWGSMVLVAGCARNAPVATAGGRQAQVAETAPVEAPCLLTTEMTPLQMVSDTLPLGVTEDQIWDATVQVLAASGLRVVQKDRDAHTIETDRFAGQTIESNCGMSRYQSYALRVAIVGRQMLVTVDCWRSLGWTARVVDGVEVPAHRDQTEVCELPAFTSKADSAIQSKVIASVGVLLGERQVRR